VKALEIPNKDSIQFMKDLQDSMLLNAVSVLPECLFPSLVLLSMPKRAVLQSRRLVSQKSLFPGLKRPLQVTFVDAQVTGRLLMPAKVLQPMLIWRISG
jgi:hypothetical protein